MTGDWRLGIRLKDWETSDSRIVISSVSEKSLSFAVRWSMFGNSQTGNLLSKEPSGIATYIFAAKQPPSFLIQERLSSLIKGQHALGADPEPINLTPKCHIRNEGTIIE